MKSQRGLSSLLKLNEHDCCRAKIGKCIFELFTIDEIKSLPSKVKLSNKEFTALQTNKRELLTMKTNNKHQAKLIKRLIKYDEKFPLNEKHNCLPLAFALLNNTYKHSNGNSINIHLNQNLTFIIHDGRHRCCIGMQTGLSYTAHFTAEFYQNFQNGTYIEIMSNGQFNICKSENAITPLILSDYEFDCPVVFTNYPLSHQ